MTLVRTVGDYQAMRDCSPQERRPGRPGAILPSLVSKVMSLHREGLGYRRIARELEKDGLSPDWSSVRRVIKAAVGFSSSAG